MRKFLMTLLLATFVLAPVSGIVAKDHGDKGPQAGGFAGPMSGVQAETVAKALELPDDAPVMLTGNIFSQIAGKSTNICSRMPLGK